MKRMFLCIVLIMIIVFGVSSISLALENSKIVEVAKKYEGVTFPKPKSKKDPAGQCKWFVQKIIREAGGKLAAGYRYCYLDIGFEISANDATAGDIIQLDDPNKNHNEKIDRNKNGKQDNYTSPMHTAIVLENLGNNKFKVIESNREKKLTVRISIWDPYKQASKKLHVHFYRLGNIPQRPQPQPPTEEPATSNNITAVVGIDDTGSMFYNDPEEKRLTAVKFFIDLMSSGDKLSIFKFGVTSKFYHSLVTVSDQNKETIKNPLRVYSNEGTDIDLAFTSAYKELEKDKTNNPKYFILLTDGAHCPRMDIKIPYKNSHTKLWEKNYKVYGIYLRSPKSPTIKSVIEPGFVPDPDFLKNVCGEKDGKGKFFESPTNQNLQQIYSEISKQVQGQKTAFDSGSFMLKPNETKKLSFVVPERSSSLQVITNWQGSTLVTSLYSKDGRELAFSSLAGPNYQIINIDNLSDIEGQSITAKVKAVDVPLEGEEARLVVRNKPDEIFPIVNLNVPKISKNPAIKISANDNIGINKVSAYFIEDGSWRKICSSKKSRLSQRLDLDDGIYTVKAEALDKAGNQSFVYQNIVIDNTKPVVKHSLKNPSWINRGGIKITAEDSNFKSLEVRNGKKITTSHKKNYLDLKVNRNDKIFIKAVDEAGNIQTKTVLINNSWWQLLKQSILDTFHIISARLAKLS